MNGLQAIKERILEDARQNAEQIAENTRQRTDLLRADGERNAKQVVESARQEAEKQAQALVSRARSVASMESRKAALQARQNMIEQAIMQAVEYLCSLPQTEKADLYIRMLQTLDDGTSHGEVQFCDADQDLASTVLERFADRYSVAPEPGKFSGGLVLRMGQIEDNVTYDLTVRNNRSELIKTAAAVLYGSEELQSGEPSQ